MNKYEVHCNNCEMLAISNEKTGCCENCKSIDIVVASYEITEADEIFNKLRKEFGK